MLHLLLHAWPWGTLLRLELLLLLVHGATMPVSPVLGTIPTLSHGPSVMAAPSATMSFVLSTSHSL
jgi:hypothetical protein